KVALILFHDRQANFHLHHFAADGISCHCALKRLALVKLEIEFRHELSDYGLAKRSCIRIRHSRLRWGLYRNENTSFDSRALQVEMIKKIPLGRASRSRIN